MGSLVQSCCGERGTLQTNTTGVCGECSQYFSCTGFVPVHGLCFSGSRLLCQELPEVGPGLRALSRSKPLRFRFLSTPQRRRLSWTCILCASQVQAAQVTRCLARAVTPRWVVGHCLLRASHSVFWMYKVCAFSGVLCVSSGEFISGYNPPSICQPSRIPRTLG